MGIVRIYRQARDYFVFLCAIGEHDGKYTISAEVYGNGIDMWLRSHGDKVINQNKKGAKL